MMILLLLLLLTSCSHSIVIDMPRTKADTAYIPRVDTMTVWEFNSY